MSQQLARQKKNKKGKKGCGADLHPTNWVIMKKVQSFKTSQMPCYNSRKREERTAYQNRERVPGDRAFEEFRGPDWKKDGEVSDS